MHRHTWYFLLLSSLMNYGDDSKIQYSWSKTGDDAISTLYQSFNGMSSHLFPKASSTLVFQILWIDNGLLRIDNRKWPTGKPGLLYSCNLVTMNNNEVQRIFILEVWDHIFPQPKLKSTDVQSLFALKGSLCAFFGLRIKTLSCMHQTQTLPTVQ